MKITKKSYYTITIYFLVVSIVFSSAPSMSFATERLENIILPVAQIEDTQVVDTNILKEIPVIIDEYSIGAGELPPEESITVTSSSDPEPYIQRDEIKSSIDKLNIETDSNTGAFVYNYPVEIPAGRSSLQPDLRLTYNSQDNDNQNLFGYGWGINIPYIARLNKTGIDKLYTDNYFSSSLTGELVAIDASGNYASKVENGEFFDYQYDASVSTWVARDKQGRTYTFGSNNLSRQGNPDDSTKIFKWMLEEMRDTNDNFIRYEYYKDGGQIYPKRIIYSGNGDRDPYVEDLTDRHALKNDSNTLVLYHMNGEVGTFEKKDNAVGDSQFNILEIGNPTSVQGFNNRTDEAYFLNGIDQYIQLDNNFSNIGNGPTTIEFWMKADLNGDYQRLVSASTRYGAESYVNVSLNNQGKILTWLRWYNDGYYNFQTISDFIIADGDWHYVSIVLENNPKASVNIFIDGILDTTNSHTQSSYHFSDFFYGWSLGAGRGVTYDANLYEFYRGAIDEFRVSNKARSASEIFDYYNNITLIDDSNIFETNDGIFEVEFLREIRDDNLEDFKSGFSVDTNYRINEIEVRVNNQLEKRYNLNYILGNNAGYAFLRHLVHSMN